MSPVDGDAQPREAVPFDIGEPRWGLPESFEGLRSPPLTSSLPVGGRVGNDLREDGESKYLRVRQPNPLMKEFYSLERR